MASKSSLVLEMTICRESDKEKKSRLEKVKSLIKNMNKVCNAFGEF